MGNKVGWLTLYSGVASGADVILIPEIPYDPIEIVKTLHDREKKNKNFSIIAVAEGAISKEEANMKSSEIKENRKDTHSVAYHLQNQLQELMIQETRVCVPGHFQRGTPTAYDRVLTTELGVEGANAILEGDFGKMIGISCGRPIRVDIKDVAGKTKKVPMDDPVLMSARQIGICFGD